VVQQLGAVQIDAVNVLVRSHYLPLFSRLGPYPLELFDRVVDRQHHVFEFFGHALSYLPVELHPYMRWRMAELAANKHWSAVRHRIEQERPGYRDAVLQQVADRGPLAFTDLADAGRRDLPPELRAKYAESSL